MKYRIPTYEECLLMVEKHGTNVFYETIFEIDGYKISSFNYRLPVYTNFVRPLENSDIDARELRGLTYVFNKDGSVYNYYLHLRKFWNLNQVDESLYHAVKDLKIKSIYTKEDGSLATFIKLPNGKVVAKTKMGFTNIQCDGINEIYNENQNIQGLVIYCLNKNLIPIFEYVSFKNQIVLNYDKEDLILLRIRNNETGEYIELDDFDKIFSLKNIRTPEKIFSDLDSLIEKSKTLKDLEGWVVEFENGLMIKVKTTWYVDRHHLLTEDLNHENVIISMFLNENLDDAKSQLEIVSNSEKLKWIDEIECKIQKIMNDIKDEVLFMLDGWKLPSNDFEDVRVKETFKLFALKNKNKRYFPLAMSVLRGQDLYENIKRYILSQTKHLLEARLFLNNIK